MVSVVATLQCYEVIQTCVVEEEWEGHEIEREEGT